MILTMIGVQVRTMILMGLLSGIAVKPATCEVLRETEELDLMGFSDTRQLRTSLASASAHVHQMVAHLVVTLKKDLSELDWRF